MNIKKILVIAEKYGLFALAGLTACAFLIAFFGSYWASDRSLAALWGALASAINNKAADATGAAQAMHVLLTATIGWAAIQVYMAAAGVSWDTISARYLIRHHVVVIAGRSIDSSGANSAGVSRLAAASVVDKSGLAVELAISLAAHHRVVLCLPALTEGDRLRLWEGGVTVLKNDLAMPQALEATGASRARVLFAMRDSYAENIVLTRAAVAPTFGNPALECKCMIEPLAEKRRFKIEDYIEADTLSRVRVFNEAELVARCMVRDNPPEASIALTNQGAHVLLIGLGSVGESILLQLARIGHYRSGLKVKVTVVDQHVKERLSATVQAYPALEQLLHVETEEAGLADISHAELDRWLTDVRPINMVYVCTKDEIANLRIARLLLGRFMERERQGGPATPRVVALDPPGGCVLAEFASHAAYQAHFKPFSLLQGNREQDLSLFARGLLTEVDDERARLLHEAYCAEDDVRCAANPTAQKAAANKPWATLPETYRNANRYSADHLDVKLRAVGRRIVRSDTAPDAPLSEPELELLARMEHERWCADRLLDGWRYGETRDNERKIHPNLLAYNQLTDPIKQLDRDNVLRIIEIEKKGDGILRSIGAVS